jgi:hypothetical protein
MMKNHPLVRGIRVKRHWDAASERYAGGDSLANLLQAGWTPLQVVIEVNGRPTHRWVTVYHFELKRGDKTVVMPVIANPWVKRLVDTMDIAGAFSEQVMGQQRERQLSIS